MDLISKAVLVLNAAHEAVLIANARRALKLIVKKKAVIEEGLGWEIYPGIEMPSVVRLAEYNYVPRLRTLVSRKNIYARDHYCCQYCGRRCDPLKLTLDHVVPKAQGGQSVWENLVACCQKCNQRKDDKTPEEAGMTLLHKPRHLTVHTSRQLLRMIGLEEDKRWAKYLYA
jgi:5-methylcytosine-specific restriction endonuclease McrA